MRIFFLFLTFAVLVTTAAFAEEDSTALNIQAARSYMLYALALENPKFDSLSEKQRNLIELHKLRFQDELQSLQIRIDDQNLAPFIHFNQKTWIETDLQAKGEIRIRSKTIGSTKKMSTAGPLLYMHFLGHEIGHHLIESNSETDATSEDEAKAWEIAQAFEKFVFAQAKTPQLFAVAIGNYNTSRRGCRDQLKVDQIDPFAGQIHLKANTSQGHCRISESYIKDRLINQAGLLYFLSLKDLQKDLYPYDQVEMSLQCHQGPHQESICMDRNPTHEFRHCPHFLKTSPSLSNMTSSFVINDSARISGVFQWCLHHDTNLLAWMEQPVMYSQESQPRNLSHAELERLQELNSSLANVSLLFLDPSKKK